MKKALSYILFSIGGFALIGICLLVGYFMGTSGLGMPMRWEIPPGYKGWVMLRSGDPSCQPYDRRGIWFVIHVANDGMACISDPRDTKWRFESFGHSSSPL